MIGNDAIAAIELLYRIGAVVQIFRGDAGYRLEFSAAAGVVLETRCDRPGDAIELIAAVPGVGIRPVA